MTYQETAYQKTNIVDSSGNVINSFGGSGGGGDASAINQTTQIALETAIRDRLPSALVGDRFKVDASSSDTNTTGNITTADIISATAVGSNNQSIVTGNPTANSWVSIAANGHNSFLIQASGTWTGTLQFEVSFDGGTTWYSGSAFLVGTGDTISSTTSNCAVRGNATDATNVRIRATSAITGTANIRINLSQTIDPITVRNGIRLYDSLSRALGSIKAASISPLATDTALVVTERPDAIAPVLSSITLTTANTEYSIVITSAKKIAFQILSGGFARYAYVSGKVATPTLPYYPLNLGAEEVEELLGKTFTGTYYFASATAGTIIVLKTWG